MPTLTTIAEWPGGPSGQIPGVGRGGKTSSSRLGILDAGLRLGLSSNAIGKLRSK